MFFDRRVPFDGEETASPWVTHLVTVYTLKTDHGNVYIWISTVLDSKDSNAFFLRVFGLLFAGMIHPWIINNPTLTTFRLSYFQSVSMQTLDAICTLSNYFQMNVRVFRILDFSKVTFGSSHVGVTMWWWWEGMSRLELITFEILDALVKMHITPGGKGCQDASCQAGDCQMMSHLIRFQVGRDVKTCQDASCQAGDCQVAAASSGIDLTWAPASTHLP